MAEQEVTTSNNIESEQSQQLVASEEPTNAVETKTITNIYYDCLERIFGFLDLESLLSFADTCKRLQIGAAHYFGDEFGETLLVLDNFDGGAPGLLVDSRFIVSTRLKMSLALLRCFGNKISYLFIKTDDHIDHLIQYIIRYCGDALIDITFHQGLPVFPIENCQQPFKNVERISVANVVLNEQLASVVHCFPFIKFFSMDGISFDPDFVGVCLPQLRYLTIKVDSDGQSDCTERGLINLMHANPQLESLSIDLGRKMALSTIMEIVSGNSSISDLVMVPNPESIRNVVDVMSESTEELTRFANEHSSLVNLYIPEYRFTADDAIAFIRQLTSLASFLFSVHGHSEFESFIDQLDKKWKVNLKAVISDVHFVELNL